MCEELKTLKDFEGNSEIMGDFVSSKLLRAEAVKWVKYDTIINWFEAFKLFFNITEEDLKDEK